MIHHLLWLNPEPWAIGSVTPRKGGARISPNLNLVAYQESVREALADAEMLPLDYRKITFYLWRQQAQYLDMSDKRRSRNQADATNMQKGLEDALQGILFENDRDVRDIRTVIVEQGHKVVPKILIVAEPYYPLEYMSNITADMARELNAGPTEVKNDNTWPPA